MPQFVIYKYDFKEGDKTLFNLETGRNALEEAQHHFSKMLQGKQLNLYKMLKNNTDSEVIKNDIHSTRNGVTLMTICKRTEVTIWKDYKELKESSYPFSHVIVDNRDGVCQIAIEQATAFDRDTDKVCNILQESIQREFTPLGIIFEIRPKMKTEDFWAMVEEQQSVRKDIIKQVVFEFPNPDKTKGMDATQHMSDKLRFLSSLAESIGAAKGALKYENTGEHGLQFERTSEDLAQMVSLFCNNAYNIAVHFRDMGVYRNGDLVRAIYPIENKILADFTNGQLTIGEDAESSSYALCDKMEHIRELTKDYNEKPQLKPRRKRRNQK